MQWSPIYPVDEKSPTFDVPHDVRVPELMTDRSYGTPTALIRVNWTIPTNPSAYGIRLQCVGQRAER
jgi:hypothetical protein